MENNKIVVTKPNLTRVTRNDQKSLFCSKVLRLTCRNSLYSEQNFALYLLLSNSYHFHSDKSCLQDNRILLN